MIVCVIYRPPDCPVTCTRDELKPKFIEALLLGKEIIILGDMNCNLLKTSCYESKILLDTCSELHLTQLIKDPTTIASQTSSLLDVIMISSSSKVKSSEVVDIGISDHSMIYCTLKLRADKPRLEYKDVRSFKNYNSESFKAELSQLPFHETYRINDVNEKIDHFNQLFINTLDKHAPIKHIRIKGRLNQFINKELKCTMKLRDKKLRIFRLSRNAEDWDVYRQLRNSIKTSLRAAESNFVWNQIEEYEGNSRSMWKVIRGCLPSKDTEKPVYQKDHKKLDNEFNEYIFCFCGEIAADKVKRLAEVNNIQIATALPPARHRSSLDLFEFRSVTPDEVRTIILNSPSIKAPGADKINIQFIKDSLEVILDHVTDIINCSLMTSTYPSMWKIAEVVPLHKEGDPEIASNNRPISLLSCLSKICDKVALNQHTEHLTNHRLLTEHQSGNQKKFLPKHLTLQ
ncbi:Hypothetical predicted protein [Paramuricea clavata]|uniref:Endonuclease/exonuclease/phosphatase domain-containing protein n=1 Tax=Paramuricea clavata TaxID=317549 RepID=A0A6S7H2I4_PARCT|nr:Hypothetical predicted protein [Paramuricea clavata]